MKFIERFNRFMFLPAMNTFDVLCIMLISQLIVTDSWWWFALYAITIPFSAVVQNIIQRLEP